ncbi:MAG: DUF1987 domain-containing protein [Salinivirgaceae bacterium]|nr:DUF1987 domain-containing protein [Salinivirgaceae bacterium]MDD4746813.1 DUF1987 domain-containing protein [Salinivirgaceae bacterium]MDY0278983.1 DUF1987 domain-containing protein [Salinivirgaceae bacterium]
MKPLLIDETNSTPQVIFDIKNSHFEIKGCSRPENVRHFFLPIVEWLEGFCTEAPLHVEHFKENPVVFKFKLSYFNSASAKFILDILLLINKIYMSDINTAIDWFYEEGDEDMLDVGTELSEMVDFNFRYIETKM